MELYSEELTWELACVSTSTSAAHFGGVEVVLIPIGTTTHTWITAVITLPTIIFWLGICAAITIPICIFLSVVGANVSVLTRTSCCARGVIVGIGNVPAILGNIGIFCRYSYEASSAKRNVVIIFSVKSCQHLWLLPSIEFEIWDVICSKSIESSTFVWCTSVAFCVFIIHSYPGEASIKFFFIWCSIYIIIATPQRRKGINNISLISTLRSGGCCHLEHFLVFVAPHWDFLYPSDIWSSFVVMCLDSRRVGDFIPEPLCL